MVTINDVAAKAGVSKRTVTRVLSGSTQVAPATRKRVLDVMKELNYVPNPLAQRLAKGRTNVVAVFCYDTSRLFERQTLFEPIIHGIGEALGQYGYHVLLLTGGQGEKQRYLYSEGVNTAQLADGVIVLAERTEETDLLRLLDEEFPFVVVGGGEVSGREFPRVSLDYVRGTEQLVRHLWECGHRYIGLWCADLERGWNKERCEGYCRAMGALHAVTDSYVCATMEVSRALDHFLTLERPPTAIIAGDDLMAMSLIREARQRGIEVPRELSVCGMGDWLPSAQFDPPLTTCDFRLEELGREAAILLVERLQREKADPKRVVLPCRLVIRDSVATK